MPRYLGIDYLADALQQHRKSLSKMLLAIPSHLESVEVYAPSGTVEDKISYSVPWEKENSFSFTNDNDLLLETSYKLSNKQPVDYLSPITSCIQYPEPFSPEKTGEELIPSSNPDSPLVSFDLWSELEEEVTNYVIQSLAPDKEHFTPMTDKAYGTENAHDRLEDLEHTDYLRSTCHQIPTAKELSLRLKTKLVQDPLLLDSKGNPLEEQTILRMDYRLTYSGGSTESLGKNDRETFTKCSSSENEDDLIAQDREIECSSSPVLSPHQSLCVKEVKESLKLEKSAESEETNSEAMLCKPTIDAIETLVDGTLANAVTGEKCGQKTKINFVSLNNEDESSPTSHTEKQQLESPSNSPSVPEDEGTKKFISSLKTMELSLEQNSPQMTPNSIKQCIQSVWENDRILFSEHLATIFPVPSTSTRKERTRAVTRTVHVTLKKLMLSEESVDGKLELEMPWDPLSISMSVMEKCQKHLQQLAAWNGTVEERRLLDDNQHRAIAAFKELFQKYSIHEPDTGTEETQTFVSENHTALTDTFTTRTRGLPTPASTSTSTRQVLKTNGSNSDEKNDDTHIEAHQATPNASENYSGGLEDFLLLRKGKLDSWKTSSQTTRIPTKTVLKAAMVRPSVLRTDLIEIDGKEPTNPAKETTDYHREITVELSAEYQEVLDELICHAKPLLFRLQDNGVISATKTLSNLNPQFTRFVLKQAEMDFEQNKDDSAKKQVFCMTVCLHALVNSVDILMQSGLEAAIAHLRATQEKYNHVLGGVLESTRRHLFQTHFTFQQHNILHPKMSELLKIVGQWVKDISQRDTEDMKAVVITYAYPEKLNKEIIETLSAVKGVHVKLYGSVDDVNSTETVGKLEVFVVSTSAIVEDFPWKSFDFVLEYDQHPEVKEELCKVNIGFKAHISLKTITKALPEAQPTITTALADSIQRQQEPFTFIGSEKVTDNVDLLHLLESRYNVLIYERRHNSNQDVRCEDGLRKMCLQPDLMIDERTCVHLQHLPSLASEMEYEKLRDTVLSLSLKCQKCFIILFSSASQTNSAFSGGALCHLSMLFANTAHFERNEFDVEIIYSLAAEETARLVRQIGDCTRDRSTVWDKREWSKRKWLTNEASAHEKFLVSFPCINSFSAQVMLTAAPLTELLNMSLGKLKETCPWIPQHTLTEFYKTANWCSEFDLPVHSNIQPHRLAQQGCGQISGHTIATEEWPFQGPGASSYFHPSPDSLNAGANNPSQGTRIHGMTRHNTRDHDLIEKSSAFNSTQRRQNHNDAEPEWFPSGYEQEHHNMSIASPAARVTLPGDNEFHNNVDPRTLRSATHAHYQSLRERDEQCFDEMKRKENEKQGRHARVPFAEDWKTSFVQRNFPKQWEVQVDEDLKRCISQNQPRNGVDYHSHRATKQSRCLGTDMPGAWGLEAKHIETGVKDYLPNNKIPSYEDVMFQPTNFSTTLRQEGHASQPHKHDGAELFLPDGFWNTNHRSQMYREDSYRGLPGVGLPHATQKVPVNLPRNRTRQAVRVLDLGDEGSHTLSTKVGIAQPQRRAYDPNGHQRVSMSRPSQVLGENSVASQHKRFSLGIGKASNRATEPPKLLSSGEHEVPGLRPSPAEDMDELSIFPSHYPSKRRKLTYQKIPGNEGGQTKLVFKYDF